MSTFGANMLSLVLVLSGADTTPANLEAALGFQAAVESQNVAKVESLTRGDISLQGRPITASELVETLRHCSGEDPKDSGPMGSLNYRCDVVPSLPGKCKAPAYAVLVYPDSTHVRVDLSRLRRTDGECVAPRAPVTG